MKTLTLLLPALLLVAAGASAPLRGSSAMAPTRPNIVLFLADDLGWADVPWHGSTARMPNLERLARDGTRLESHYVHPMCSPTRAALLTGRYASRFGVTKAQNERALPWNTVSLASALKQAGYDTALVGKWHLGSRPEEGPRKFGFDHGYGSLAGGVTPYTHRYKEGPFSRTWHRDGRILEEKGHVTDLLAEEAVRWVDSRSDRPFFLYVPFTAIHVPIDEPDRWQAVNPHLTDPAQRLRAAAASHMDDAIGRVLAALERRKLRENTLVLFLSDNGAHPPTANQGGPYPGDFGPLKVGNDNRPWRGFKTEVYEGGIRTPGVAHWPGRIPQRELDAPIHAVDWMPTLCALSGAAPRGELKWDGRDIGPLLFRRQTHSAPRTLYSAGVSFGSAAVRHGNWKLVTTYTPDRTGDRSRLDPDRKVVSEELFDLSSDPAEAHNLAAPEPERLREMRNRLKEISARDGDAAVRPAAVEGESRQ